MAFGHELIQYNMNVEYKSSNTLHYKQTSFIKPIDLKKHCWTSDLKPDGESYSQAFPSQVVYENNFFFTLDFPTQTYVQNVVFKSSGF